MGRMRQWPYATKENRDVDIFQGHGQTEPLEEGTVVRIFLFPALAF